MSKLTELLQEYKQQQRISTILSGICLVTGALSMLPILSDKVFTERVRFCTQFSECSGGNVFVSTKSAFEKEKENSFFSENIRELDTIPSQDNKAIPTALIGSIFFLAAYGIRNLLLK